MIKSHKPHQDMALQLTAVKTTEVYDTYWRFAAERQRIFFARITGNAEAPLTKDGILSQYKFTNAYRAADRVSQYLIREVIARSPNDLKQLFFRIILFKIFNRISTWELLERELGEVSYYNNFIEDIDNILQREMLRGRKIYSAAYIMPSGGHLNTTGRKHRMHLELLNKMLTDELPEKIHEATCMRDAFQLLRSYPTIGDFLAYQYITDINYSSMTNFSEMEFVVPGPGAMRGIAKCFSDYGGLSEVELIRLMTDRQETEFEKRGLKFQSLWGRRLQLIDCQNLFCEVDKYSRVAHPDLNNGEPKRIKQKFTPSSQPINYQFPAKWNLNDKIPISYHDSLF